MSETGRLSKPAMWLPALFAGALAVLHLIQSSWAVDKITLGLLAVASLPWLATIVQSIKLPGFEVKFRKLKAETEQLRQEVQTDRQRINLNLEVNKTLLNISDLEVRTLRLLQSNEVVRRKAPDAARQHPELEAALRSALGPDFIHPEFTKSFDQLQEFKETLRKILDPSNPAPPEALTEIVKEVSDKVSRLLKAASDVTKAIDGQNATLEKITTPQAGARP